LLASGRDADIFEYGEGLVLRRARNGRSLAYEARVMEYLRGQGYPVPAVEEMGEDESDLVIERVDGPSMVQAIGARPWTVRRHGRMLAELHLRLHNIEAPGFVTRAPIGSGSAMLHLDLHPLNVIIGRHGPVVIDWPGAAAGDADLDVGLAWVLMAAGEIPMSRVRASLLGWGRDVLLGAFLDRFDRSRVAAKLRSIVELKVQDPHMSVDEVANMWRVVERAETPR
jgi:aminoglycoside phosphotransferase (APT) family kinase protein